MKNSFNRTLDNLSIHLKTAPEYAKTASGTVDVSKIDISEIDAREYVRAHTKHYTEENLDSDVSSALGIHRIRNGRISHNIEQCGAVFVTTNTDFTRAFNQYYGECFGGDIVMPVMTAFELSAITWVKGGAVAADIPERQLLVNAYAALQPSPEVFEKIGEMLQKMVTEGTMSNEEAILLRLDRVTQKELWTENTIEGTGNVIDERYIDRLREKHNATVVSKTTAEVTEVYRAKEEKDKKERSKKARAEAARIAEIEYCKYKKTIRVILLLVEIVVLLACVVATVVSFKTSGSSVVAVLLIVFAIVNVLSIVLTLKETETIIWKWIEKRACHHKDNVFEKKKEEFDRII